MRRAMLAAGVLRSADQLVVDAVGVDDPEEPSEDPFEDESPEELLVELLSELPDEDPADDDPPDEADEPERLSVL
jgi:hypothetical protein